MKPNSIASIDDLMMENSNETSNSVENNDEDTYGRSHLQYDDNDNENDDDSDSDNPNNQDKYASASEYASSGGATASSTGVGCASRSVKRKSKYNYTNRKRKCRTTFSKMQLQILENEFVKSNFVSNDKIDSIVDQTGLDSRIIKNWFKNKRSRVLADSKVNTNTKIAPTLIKYSPNYLHSSPNDSKSELDTSTPPPPPPPNVYFQTHSVTPIKSILSSPISRESSIIKSVSHPRTFDNEPPNIFDDSKLKPINHLNNLDEKSANHSNQTKLDLTNKHPTPVQMIDYSSYGLNISVTPETPSANSHQDSCKLNNRNLNGLLNIVNSIGKTDPVKRPIIANDLVNIGRTIEPATVVSGHHNNAENVNCPNCTKSNKIFCACNISKMALNKLYKHYLGFNSNNYPTFNHNYYHPAHGQNGDHTMVDFTSSIAHPFICKYNTKRYFFHPKPNNNNNNQSDSLKKDVYFYDTNETEKIFFVL